MVANMSRDMIPSGYLSSTNPFVFDLTRGKLNAVDADRKAATPTYLDNRS
jgi:hypothetical protein